MPQEVRFFGDAVQVAYRYNSTTKDCVESGANLAGLVTARHHVALEFTTVSVVLTRDQMSERKKRTILLADYMYKIAREACGAMNARLNLTIYLGITDGGIVKGIQFEDDELVPPTCLHILNCVLANLVRVLSATFSATTFTTDSTGLIFKCSG